jgi:hypothetical protein
MNKIAEWLDICKTHWKEIFAISFILHFVTDLLIIGPLFYILGAVFGLPVEWANGGH